MSAKWQPEPDVTMPVGSVLRCNLSRQSVVPAMTVLWMPACLRTCKAAMPARLQATCSNLLRLLHLLGTTHRPATPNQTHLLAKFAGGRAKRNHPVDHPLIKIRPGSPDGLCLISKTAGHATPGPMHHPNGLPKSIPIPIHPPDQAKQREGQNVKFATMAPRHEPLRFARWTS